MRTLLCAFYRREAGFVRRYNTRLISHIAKSEGPAAAAAFKREIHQAMFPFRLSGHGYRLPFSERNRAEVAQKLKALMRDIEAASGCPVFINSGTLLGAYRDKDFIAHDDDIDLAIHLGDEGEEQAAKRLLDVMDILTSSDLLDRRKVNMALMKAKPIDDIEIDIFPAWSSEGK